jgi:hypothetical protein
MHVSKFSIEELYLNMASSSTNDSIGYIEDKPRIYTDAEKQPTVESNEQKKVPPQSLGSGVRGLRHFCRT